MFSLCSSTTLLLIFLVCGRAEGSFQLTPADRASPSEVTCGLQCSCHDRALSCVGSSSFHLLKIPVVRPPDDTFNSLDFSSNRISTIEKGVWLSYPQTETLILKHNLLGRIHADAFEGLQRLKFLDLSCNVINVVDPQAFQPVPLLSHLDLSGNDIHTIQNGTFQTRDGLQHLTYVKLAHNPLETFGDKSLFHVESLDHLDVSATLIPLTAVEDLMLISSHLGKAVLPLPVMCCLCLAEKDMGQLSISVQLHCLSICYEDPSQCGYAENPFDDDLFLDILRARRRHFTDTLRIEPAMSSGTCQKRDEEPKRSTRTQSAQPAKSGRKLSPIARTTIVALCAFAATSVISGLSYLLRKVSIKRYRKEPQEIIRMEEGRSRKTETDQ